MSLVPLTNWFNKVLPYVPGCTEPLALDAIRDAAIDFCQRSWAHHVQLDPISTTATVSIYPYADVLDEDLQAVAAMPLEVYLGNDYLPFKSPDDMKELFSDRNWQTQTGAPLLCTQLKRSELILVPIPAEGSPNGLRVRVALKPKRDATDIDEEMWEEYANHIAAGALEILYLNPKKPWTNPQAAGIEHEKFEAAINAVRATVQRGFGRARRHTTGVYF